MTSLRFCAMAGANAMRYEGRFSQYRSRNTNNPQLDRPQMKAQQTQINRKLTALCMSAIRGNRAGLMFLVCALSSATVNGQFMCQTNNGTLTITRYTGPGGAVIIPEAIDGLSVVSIGWAFHYNSTITSVTIPDSVLSIEDGYMGAGGGSRDAGAFMGCSSLTNVVIGNGVRRIGTYAFWYCGNLTTVAMGGNVSAIGKAAFSCCSQLTELTLPESVTTIEAGAFSGCSSLTNVSLGTSLKNIEAQAFDACTNLAEIILPGSVTNIGACAFYNCSSLTSFAIPNSVTFLGSAVLGGCSKLARIDVDPLNEAYSSSDGVLFDKPHRTLVLYPPAKPGSSLSIPNSVIRIENGAVKACTSLTEVTIPDSVIHIGAGAFAGCTGLSSLAIPGSVISWGLDGIDPVSGGTTVLRTFADCTNLGAVTIAHGVSILPSFAFDGCIGLTNVAIPLSVVEIGVGAFSGCAALSSVAIPDNVTFIRGGAFARAGLLSVTLPGSLTNLESYAFAGCTNLSNVTVPSTITSIGQSVFIGCTGLTNATILNDAVGSDQFGWCTSLTSVSLGDKVRTIDYGAFRGCTKLTSIIIPKSVININDWAFENCSGLINVHFEGDAPSGEVQYGVFSGSTPATIYYLPGTIGWGPTYCRRPCTYWVRPNPVILTTDGKFGLRTNTFGFTISWVTNTPVVIEGCSDLANSNWIPLRTNALTNGSFFFSDADWMSFPVRFYRVRQW
jgi:hypothetical protein